MLARPDSDHPLAAHSRDTFLVHDPLARKTRLRTIAGKSLAARLGMARLAEKASTLLDRRGVTKQLASRCPCKVDPSAAPFWVRAADNNPPERGCVRRDPSASIVLEYAMCTKPLLVHVLAAYAKTHRGVYPEVHRWQTEIEAGEGWLRVLVRKQAQLLSHRPVNQSNDVFLRARNIYKRHRLIDSKTPLKCETLHGSATAQSKHHSIRRNGQYVSGESRGVSLG